MSTMKKMLPCIGLVGYKGSGKNTAAELIQGLGYDVTEKSFALALRFVAAGIFDYDINISFTEEGKNTIIESVIPLKSDLVYYDMCETRINLFYSTFEKFRKGSKYFVSIRDILQLLGTEVYRATDDTYWLDQVDIENGVVITDVRFPNEAEYIKENGGYLFKITKEDYVSTDTHSSEKYIDSIVCDFYINNDGKNLDTLSLNLYRAIESLRNKICN